ncbi:MAG: PKD domain-containing protein [Aureispira sp.]|nr:PKD domain-containing protein [Aureispira sp.]
MKALLISMLLMASHCFAWSQLIPDFTADITHACENALVQFQDSSSSINNIKSWSWTVDGTLFSNQANPTYYFSHAGDYDICLTIEDSLGNTQSVCKPNYIKIHRSPIASFSSDQQWTCGLPSTINFTDNSVGTDTNLVRWVWDYGDGVLDSSMQSPSHPYQITGIFDVTLIVRDANGCSNSALASDYIHINNVTATIESNHSDTICQLPVSVNFWPANISGAGNISYQWNFGNGSTANTQMALSYYDSAGTYPIHLILQDSFCTDTIYSPTGVSANVLNADFLIDTVAGCKILEPTVQALPNNLVVYEFWDFDFENNFAINTPIASYEYQSPGRYQIMHILGDSYGCLDTAWQTIDISDPVARIASDQVSGCIPLTANFADSSYNKHSLIPIINWDWQLDSTLNSTAQHPSMIYADTGVYPVKLIITDALGCKDSTTLLKTSEKYKSSR